MFLDTQKLLLSQFTICNCLNIKTMNTIQLSNVHLTMGIFVNKA